MLIAAIFKSTYYYTLAFSPQLQHGNKDTQALKQGLLPPSLGKMKSPSATSSSPPRPPRKSLTLQKAEKVWLLSILLRNMSSRMSATAGTGTVTFFYYVMQNDNIRRKKTSIQLDHFCGFLFLLQGQESRRQQQRGRHFFFVQSARDRRDREQPCKYWFLVINLTP